ncbi:MAG: DUF6046 domain-containing protein [Bacteroidales bacterium]|jgi:hypothetical protein|nr:hypothetical protein [Bacteroidales bacterium]
MKSKILIYLSQNMINAGRMATLNLGLQESKKSLLHGALASPIEVYTKKEELKTADSNISNEIYLKTDNGDIIVFIDAKIDVSKEMLIKNTMLVNRKGSVKEFVYEKDYSVKISGSLFTEEAGKFPYDELKLLNEILSTTGSLSVDSAYLDVFGISKLVVKKADFNQSSWKYFNIVPFTIDFLSDEDYDFLIN